MRQISEFLKTTALGGLFVVLPVLLLYLLLGEILDLVVGLATPIVDLFPKGTFDNLTAPFPIAVALIVGVSFVFGLALRVEVGRRIGDWIEGKVFGRLPMYSALKSLTGAFREAGEGAAFRPALLVSSDGSGGDARHEPGRSVEGPESLGCRCPRPSREKSLTEY